MSKKGMNILSDEKIKGNLFDADNEEDTNELKKIQSLLSQSKENSVENDDNNNDLNNKTNVSDRDIIYEDEIKDAANKLKEKNNDENELSETYLTNKNSCYAEENSLYKSDDNIEINKLNKNINIKNEIEPNVNKNINNQKLLLNKNNDDIQEYSLNEKYEIDEENQKLEQKKKIPIFFIRKIKKRSKKIQFLRKKKGIHLIRKKDSDIIRKKIKTYFHNYLIDKLNIEIKIINWKKLGLELNTNSPHKKSKRKKVNKFLKFNNKFTTNVSINLNRNLLLKKIYQILIEEPISTKYKSFHLKNNCYLARYLLSMKSFSNIHKLLNSTYEDCYKEFLKSPHFQKILENIKKKDGIFYLNKFKNVSFNFISFYTNKGRQKNSPKKGRSKDKFLSIKSLNNEKEESKRNKKSKKSRRSISFFVHNKTPNNSDENKFHIKNFSSLYLHSINSKNNIISLIEDYQSFNIFSKEESDNILCDKSYIFKDLYENSNKNSFFKENEENSYEPKEYKISDDMDNLSIIKKFEGEKGENDIFNEFMKINKDI